MTPRPADKTLRRAAPRVVLIHAAAPAKPPTGAPCNGCGLCCAHAPCPLGVLLSRRRQGRCAALRWDAVQTRYACDALARPARWLPWLPAAWARALVARWIAAAQGCDASLQAVAAPVQGHGEPPRRG